jgi:hypothetical protein
MSQQKVQELRVVLKQAEKLINELTRDEITIHIRSRSLKNNYCFSHDTLNISPYNGQITLDLEAEKKIKL